MSILDKILKPIGKLLGVKEPPRPKLTTTEKSKTDIALPFIVGNDYIKLEPAIVFKRDNEDANQVGLVAAWATGPVDIAVQQPELWVGNTPGTDRKYRFNPGTEEASLLAWSTRGGGPITGPSNWVDFNNLFGYQADMFGRGIVHSVIKYHKDPDIFESDPSNDFWLKVRKGNCRRVDGTSNGLSDAWADNPFAVIQWFMNDTTIGMDIPTAMFGNSFADSIAWLESNLVSQNGSNKKRFTVNGVIGTDKEYIEVLEIFEKHCFSKISFIEGKLEIATKGRVTTPFIDFNDSNIVGEVDVTPVSAQDAYTQVEVSWVNPDKNFEKDFALYPATDSAEHTAALEKANFIENIEKIDLELCNNYFEAFEHARIVYRESQDRVDVTFTAFAEASQLIPYDIISVTDVKRGWDEKLFIVEKVEEKDENGLELYEVEAMAFNPTTYEWSGEGEYTPDPVYDGTADKIDAVTNLTWLNGQRLLTWDAPAQQVITYSVYVNDRLVANTRSTSYELTLADGSYTIAVIPQGLFQTGESAQLSITVSPITMPAYTLSVNPGFIIVKPPVVQNGFYEFRYSTIDDFNTSEEAPSGAQFQLNFTNEGTTYYFWVRYVTTDYTTNWLQQSAVGQAQDLLDWTFAAGPPNPSDGTVGSRYTNTTNGDIYVKSASGWDLIGNFSANDGDAFLSGTGTPSSGLGSDGDIYLNLTNYELFKKESGSWVSQGIIAGPTGPIGPPGADGSDGVDGTDPVVGITNVESNTFQWRRLNDGTIFPTDRDGIVKVSFVQGATVLATGQLRGRVTNNNSWVVISANPGFEGDFGGDMEIIETLNANSSTPTAIVRHTPSNVRVAVNFLIVFDGEDGADGPPGADAPGANSVRDDTPAADHTSLNDVTVFQVTTTAANNRIRAEVSGIMAAFIFNPETDIATRISMRLTRDGTTIAGTYQYDPSPSGFTTDQFFTGSWDLANQPAGTYRLVTELDTAFTADTQSTSYSSGYLQADES